MSVDFPQGNWPERFDAGVAALLTDTAWIAYFDLLPHDRVQEWQRRRLAKLLAHARRHSAWWQERLPPSARECATTAVEDLPVIGREQYRVSVETAGGSLEVPAEHGSTSKGSTSGSVGAPVEFYTSALAYRLFNAEWRHDDDRHGRDRSRLRAELSWRAPEHSEEHAVVKGNALLGTADGFHRRVQFSTLEEHARWLSRIEPAYLVTIPSLLSGMLDAYESGRVKPPRIDQVLTFAETIDASLRQRARSVLGAAIRDRYSCEEVGPIAFQCPHSEEHYHVASSNAVIEILDDDDRPCPPDTIGRVVVTGLHNFASPVIRYELNDLAAWQPRCACGRSAPVLTRLLGRKRFLIHLPSGEWKVPRIGPSEWLKVAPIRENRIVQVSEWVLRAELVLDRPLSDGERAAVVALLRTEISPDLTYEIRHVERIDWTSTYKRQDVISLL